MEKRTQKGKKEIERERGGERGGGREEKPDQFLIDKK